MGVTAPATELTMSFSIPIAHLRLEQIRGGAELAGSVCVAAVPVGALFPVLPGVTEHSLTQVWSNPQVQARVRKAAIIIAFTRHEEPGAKFRAAELLSDCWFHRCAEGCANWASKSSCRNVYPNIHRELSNDKGGGTQRQTYLFCWLAVYRDEVLSQNCDPALP